MKNNDGRMICMLIHGSFGSPCKGFFPWLYESLSSKGYTCYAPHFPSLKGQNYKEWSKILDVYLENGYINEFTTIITHSLGSVFIAKFLSDRNIKIAKLVTVAGFNNLPLEDSYLYDTFYISKKSIDVAGDVTCIYSLNDPFIPVEYAKSFAELIHGKCVEIPSGGHFTRSDGYEKFEELLKYI